MACPNRPLRGDTNGVLQETPRHVDREDWPLIPGAYVHVDRVSRSLGVRVRYRGVVHGFREDTVGPVVDLREFADGKFTGRMRVVRPRDMVVKRPPPTLRALKAEDSRLQRRAAMLKGQAKQNQKRKRRGR